ncbi:RTA1 like protein-domain-containing protein [Favolaschia claudopus]|uniref:RTA1 like protein-domain-containing protein n=1 Tax=Favolaschia claudopus TaxID=2862362 RepID=A0AAW0BTU1_9AGAR
MNSTISLLSQLVTRDSDESQMTDLELDNAQYGYIPSESVAILFLVLYGISTVLHIGQSFYFRLWWLLPTAALCGVGELVGWGGRLWSSFSPREDTPFIIQISTTILAPTPLLAASFMIMSRLIQRLGASYSWLTPTWYTRIFLPCDIIALVVQGVGGGIASSADDQAGAEKGAQVMLGGIGFQFAVIIIFSILALDFTTRYLLDRPVRRADSSSTSSRKPMTPRLKVMSIALGFSTVVLFIRSVYRLIELNDGWNGRIIETEVYFNVLDGGMVVLAIFTLNLIHPGVFLAAEPQLPSAYTSPSEIKLRSQESV